MGLVVMTGATSGLGAVALAEIVAAGETVIVGARGAGATGTQTLPLDLESLDSVRRFATAIEGQLDGRRIDRVVLNAGGYGHGRTAEGYDATFVINYLGHYLLLRRLWPLLADGATVILTTSGTHDPAERTIVPPPRHANALWLARPELDAQLDAQPRRAGARAYASSKLCVILWARALARATDARQIRVVAYDPGPTPGTGLARGLSAPARFAWTVLPGVVRFLMRKKANTVADAGRCLAELALGRVAIPDGRVYAALRRGALTWPEPSELARRDDAMVALERDSAELAGARAVGELDRPRQGAI
jgi:NAD(P)-dependent dehydrogenase (short-subunit alcohol dehydrogenase family)